MITFGHINVRSLTAHFIEFKNCVLLKKFDVLAVSETWLTNFITDKDIGIDGYNVIRRDRNGNGGGVAFYVRSQIKYKVLQTNNNSIEHLCLELFVSNKSYGFCVVYKPPKFNVRHFFDEFENILSDVLPLIETFYCTGDFNVNLLNTDCPDTRVVCDFFETMGLHQVIDQPTRITSSTATLIDYILTTKRRTILDVVVECVDFSDHELLISNINIEIKKKEIVYKTVRNFKAINQTVFYEELQSLPWRNIFDIEGLDDKVEFLTNNIICLLDRHAPYVTYKISKNYAPWMTDTLRIMKKKGTKY